MPVMAINTNGDLGTVMGVWAHPDDEAYLSAGLMATAVDAGRRVVCVTATKGEAGFPLDDPRSVGELAALRVAELDACLRILGVTDHRFLGYDDGGCDAVDDDEAAERIAAIIREVRPDTVLTFGPDGATGHPDHIAACRWATLAIDRVAAAGERPPRLLYATKAIGWAERVLGTPAGEAVLMVEGFQPEAVDPSELVVHFACDGDLLDRKFAALSAQASQIGPFVAAIGESTFREFVADEFFRDRRDGDRAVTIPNARR